MLIRNKTDHLITVIVEPLGREYSLSPDKFLDISEKVYIVDIEDTVTVVHIEL